MKTHKEFYYCFSFITSFVVFSQPGHMINKQGKYWEFYTPILRTILQYSYNNYGKLIVQCVFCQLHKNENNKLILKLKW